MINSMTAFGRSEFRNSKGFFSVEIQSVNRKYQEISIILPKELSRFEPRARKLVGEKVDRGKVSVFVNVEFNPDEVTLIRPNVAVARTLLKTYQLLAKELGYDKRIDLSYVLRNKDVIEHVQNLENVDEFWPAVAKTISRALREICRMKKVEGKAIAEDFVSRLNEIQKMLRTIKKNAEKAVAACRQKLIDRINEITGNKLENEERVLREVAIYADKTDITEEITRLESHIKQFRVCLKVREPVGRTLDFLVQEMHREINTIGSKSSNLKISSNVVMIKSELEKIREQVQNIA